MRKKRIIKWAVGIILTPILLFLILAILLYIPPIQNWAVKKVMSYASEQTGMEISIERVKLVFPLDLGVDGFLMIQQNDSLPQVKDTIADVKNLIVEVQLKPLFKKNVEIDALEFKDVKLNTANFVHEARVKGTIGRLHLRSHGIDLSKETIKVNEATLANAKVDIELSDTVPPDTSTTKNNWKISVDELAISGTGITVHMPGDTLQIAAYLGKTKAVNGYFDLYSGLYKIQSLDWKEGSLAYDNNYETFTKGLDANHIALSNVSLGIDSIYYCAPDLKLSLRECSFKEKSGLTVERFTGPISMDSVNLYLPKIDFKTSDSYLTAQFIMALNAFDDNAPGKLRLTADCSIGKQDILRVVGDMPTDITRRLPNQPLRIKAAIVGNMKSMNFGGVNVNFPSAFNISINGTAGNLTDTDKLNAKVKLDANTYNLDFVSEILKSQGTDITIPRNISIKGNIGINRQSYTADLTANEGGGNVKVKGSLNSENMKYNAMLIAKDLKIGHFMPGNEFGNLSGNIVAKGKGMNFTSPKTQFNANASVEKFNIGQYNLDGISLNADMANGKAKAKLNSDNPLVKGLVTVNALLNPKMLQSTLTADVKHADWYGLHMVESELSTSLKCRIDVSSDLKTMLRISGKINDLEITDSSKVFRPDDLMVDILTSRDTTHFVTECGDFRLHLNGQGGYKKLLGKADNFVQELKTELKSKQINISKLRQELPLAQLYLVTGKDNPLSRFIAHEGYTFQDASIDVSSSPEVGLNGNIQLLELQNSSMKLDTVRFNITSDSVNCTYSAQIRNNKDNKQYVFNALLDGYVFEKGSGANIKFYDARDSLGLKLGAEASMEDKGIKLHLLTDEPILGYKKFKVNEDNYIYMGTDRRVSANLRLMAADGTGVHIYSNDDNTEALQDLTIGLNKFDLEKVLSVVPYMPNITGIMNGDFHIIQMSDNLSLSAAISVDKMTYERSRMGNISTEFVYMPQSGGAHSLDGVLNCNNKQVAELSGTYNSEGEGNLDAKLTMSRMPARLINGFIPDRIIRLNGYANGEVALKGTLDKPQANGEIKFDSCYMRSAQYGVRMRFSEDPLRIVGSNLLFEDFKMYANNDNPLTLNGNIDFSNLDNMNMDLRMVARNCQVIDSKENRRSIAFGKAFVDFFATMRGPVERLEMLGRLDVLGTTDMSYILRDTPLSTDNRMDDLVKFVSFEDTVATVVEHQPMSGFTMDLTMNIDQGAHVMCYLDAAHSNYLDIMGGGSLRMQYDMSGNIRLTGRYTLDNGEMKYSLPVIPLKTFTIQDGSYIEFTGDPMNPKLNITATERTKASVSSGGENGDSRDVEFDCGVIITKTLSDMGLEFTLSAPEDMTLNSELQSMSVEQRGKLAVTMLTTGMYLSDGNTGGFSMNNALNSFLQSEINSITGNALRSLDLSFGMDNSTGANGDTHTDYSFKFSKRFWNNRLRIVVGGKVSTGADVTNQNESFFDNVTFEYRLGNSSDKYVKLYYDNNAYDWLEGTVREYGFGFIWRRSLQHFKDIFSFGKKKVAEPAKADSTSTKRQDVKKH